MAARSPFRVLRPDREGLSSLGSHECLPGNANRRQAGHTDRCGSRSHLGCAVGKLGQNGCVTDLAGRAPAGQLRPAIVLSTSEDACTVSAGGRTEVVPYARIFPAPRTERVAPGHLVAVATAAGGSDVVIWRWFDAVVLEGVDGAIRLWEPGHGTVLAQPRDRRHIYLPGSRAYLSAGLPGAEWWVAGPAVDRSADADVELDEVQRFFTSVGLWEHLT